MIFFSNYKTLPVLILVILFFGLAAWFNLSSGSFLWAATSPDAIAFRVMPNPGHLSPLRWYQENIKLKGSPQTLVVDGYNAVRDGRTVYVNAANVVIAADPKNNKFFTNIYIISYNQQAESATVDIFGQILAHWKFNTNLTPEQKISVRKDTKRLADLSDINLALDNYQKAHDGDYPTLSAGSYLAGKSISVWPSWQAALAKELGITLPIDPDNKLGTCLGYDSITCWNQTTKKFADPIPDNNFDLPADSHAYVYLYNGKKSYNTCALMQSGFLTTLVQGACAGSAVGSGPVRVWVMK